MLNILNSLPSATLAIDSRQVVVGINNAARQILGIDTPDHIEIQFGQLLYCHNVLSGHNCGAGLLCRKCLASDLFAKVFETKGQFSHQEALINTTRQNEQFVWRISMSVGYALFMGNDYCIATIHNAVLETESECNAQSVLPNQSQTSECKVEAPSLIDHRPNLANDGFRKVDALLYALFPNIAEGIIVIDNNRRIVSFNPRISKLLGVEFDMDIEPLLLWDIVEADNKAEEQERLNSYIASNPGFPYSFNGTVVTKNGLQVPSSFTIVPLSDYMSHMQGWIIIVKDLTLEKNLRAQIEMNHFAVENAPNEYMFCDSHGFVEYANKQARSSFGWDLGQYRHANLQSIMPNKGNLRWKRLIRTLIRKDALQLETHHFNRLGEIYPVMVSVYMLRGKPHNSLCYIAYNHSVQKNIQDRFAKEAKINQNMAEISKELSNVDKFNTVSLLVRQYALEITESQFGFLAYRDPINNELVTSIYSDSSYSYKHEVELLVHFFEEHSLKNGPEAKRNSLNIKLDSLLVKGFPITQILPFDKMAWEAIEFNDSFKGLLFVARKNTDYSVADIQHLQNLCTLFGLAINRIQETSSTKEMNEKLLMAMNVANLGTFEWNLKKHIVEVSQQWLDLLGYGNHSTLVKVAEIVSLIHPHDKKRCFRSFLQHIHNKSQEFRFVSRIKNGAGDYQWIQSIGKVVKLQANGTPSKIISVHFDITEQMKLNQELVQAKEEAVSASKAKSVFIARMSHELRTPLNAINGFADLLRNTTSDATILGYLSSIKKSGISLLDMINDLLDFSKIESGKMSLRPSQVDLYQLIKDTIFIFSPLAEEKHLVLRFSKESNFPKGKLWIDETRLRQVLSNLIGNAIKFTEKGSVEVVVNTQNQSESNADISISIIDTGIGIKPESQKTIFDDFVQQDGQDNRRYGGTGLGLGIVKRLVELMEGAIHLTSETGKGSHFRVELPSCALYTQDCSKPEVIETEKLHELELSIQETTSAQNNKIDPYVKTECQIGLADTWPDFRERPSFSKILPIAEVLSSIGNRLNVGELLVFANRLNACYADFNVEELKKCIGDIEKFAELYIEA